MKLHDVIFCDDIRNEVNNKLSLMGVYNDIIIFHVDEKQVKWPMPFKLGIVLRFDIIHTDEYPERFEFEYFMNNKNITNISGTINKMELEHSQINLSLIGQGIPLEPGDLGFSIKLFNGNKLLLSEKNPKALNIIAKPNK